MDCTRFSWIPLTFDLHTFLDVILQFINISSTSLFTSEGVLKFNLNNYWKGCFEIKKITVALTWSSGETILRKLILLVHFRKSNKHKKIYILYLWKLEVYNCLLSTSLHGSKPMLRKIDPSTTFHKSLNYANIL